jgi:hypothetical protein
MGSCQRYSKQVKEYVAIPQPNINTQYNWFMEGVDLLDNAEKNYTITTPGEPPVEYTYYSYRYSGRGKFMPLSPKTTQIQSVISRVREELGR